MSLFCLVPKLRFCYFICESGSGVLLLLMLLVLPLLLWRDSIKGRKKYPFLFFSPEFCLLCQLSGLVMVSYCNVSVISSRL